MGGYGFEALCGCGADDDLIGGCESPIVADESCDGGVAPHEPEVDDISTRHQVAPECLQFDQDG